MDIEKIIDAFEINADLLPAANNFEDKFKAFRALLIRRIEELAESNMEQLMWRLYRIDVSEKKLKAELQKHPASEFATVIADAIIQREVEKAESRKKFSEGKSEEWSFEE
jgi:hypothetical protein